MRLVFMEQGRQRLPLKSLVQFGEGGFGKFGQTFAIPTKDHNIQTLPLSAIQDYVDMFLGYAKLHPELEFLLTRIGCGLAGYSDKEIAPLFKNDILPNIIYPKEWNFTSYSV